MAAFSLSLQEQDLSCPVCLEVFSEPAVLSCGHSFCSACVQQSWTRGAGSAGRECPVCRQQAAAGEPLPDRALRRICEAYVQQKRDRERGSDSGELLCSLHLERLHLFCVDDEKLVCVQCVSQDHQNHSFCSISKAARPHKETLLSHLSTLGDQLQNVKKVKDLSDQEAVHIRAQAQHTEEQIKEEFEKLYRFLRMEEEARITALKQEEEEKSRRMKKKTEDLDEQMRDVSSRITELEDKLKDDVSFLLDFRRTYERTQYRKVLPERDSGVLIDVAKHLGNLRYRVWEKMKNISPYFPVVLDPNSANPSLSLSPDLSQVSISAINTQLPENPERMSAYAGVLGSEGFSSGTHSWEVDVGDSVSWVVGVAEESVERKQNCTAVPENGFFCIWREKNDLSAATSMDSRERIAPLELKRFRVTLHWEDGQVTFSNANNNITLYTFTHRFTKNMYPYFYNNSPHSMKILPDSVKPRS